MAPPKPTSRKQVAWKQARKSGAAAVQEPVGVTRLKKTPGDKNRPKKPTEVAPQGKQMRRGRKRDPIPKNELQSLLLAEFGPKIAFFFHRNTSELLSVYYAWNSGGHPEMAPNRVSGLEQALREQGFDESTVASELRDFCHGPRERWSCLMAERWQKKDFEFFELLALVRANPRPPKLTVGRLVGSYISCEKGEPTEQGFLSWLRHFKILVTNRSRKLGGKVVHDDVVHREEATRAFKMHAHYLTAQDT